MLDLDTTLASTVVPLSASILEYLEEYVVASSMLGSSLLWTTWALRSCNVYPVSTYRQHLALHTTRRLFYPWYNTHDIFADFDNRLR